ncbi:hypothetical protein KKA14_21495 [bacterium]|nr:hypothetical protein [bacterium]
MKKRILALFTYVLLITPFALSADQFYGGVGVYPTSGQPNYIVDGITNINVAFEAESLWRFSLTNTSFKHKDEDANKLKSLIFGVERMWVYKVNTGMTVIGAFGPGLFNSTAEGSADDSGTAVGLMATGSFRYAITDKLFVDGAVHYKNVAVKIDEYSVNGGYIGLFVNVGFFF